MASVGLGLGL